MRAAVLALVVLASGCKGSIMATLEAAPGGPAVTDPGGGELPASIITSQAPACSTPGWQGFYALIDASANAEPVFGPNPHDLLRAA